MTTVSFLIQHVDDQARAQFRLKPSGLGRHDVARVVEVLDRIWTSVCNGYKMQKKNLFGQAQKNSIFVASKLNSET